MVNELILRRGLMGAKSGSAIDWESIARGMCDGVTEFSIPIEAGLYGMCSCNDRRGLLSVVVASGTGTNQSMFYNCAKLKTATLPSTISNIRSFTFRACVVLEEVIIEATTPPTLGSGAFQDCRALTSIYVPDASVEAYKTASNWSTYANIIKPISQRPT